MRQARFRLGRPFSGRLFSCDFRYQDLTVNFVIVSASLWLLSSPLLLKLIRHVYAWSAFQLAEGFLSHLPGVSLFLAIAATILFVQEVEKRRRQQP